MTLETDDSMGMSSVREAPHWGHDSPAVRREPALVLGGPARLALVSADASQLSFEGRGPALAPILLSPLFFALSALPWLAPNLDAVRAATSGLFLLVASGLVRWGWPRRRRVVLVAKGPAPTGAHRVQPAQAKWVLEAWHVPNALNASYAVTLQPDEGEAITVLENGDPERVLWQLSEVLRHWPGPVECRWGLPAMARPWSIEPHSGPRSRAGDATPVEIVTPGVHRSLVWSTRIMAVLVVTDLIFLVTSASKGLSYIHPLSLVLPVLLASCIIALTLALGSYQQRLDIGARVRRETSLLGKRKAHGDIRVESVRGVYALGLPNTDRWHVLIDSSDGPLALPVARERAEALTRETEQAIQAARTSI